MVNDNPPYYEERIDFESFKSNVCHRVKRLGDIDFVRLAIERDDIRSLWDRKWRLEALYLLAMVDYLCRVNNRPIPSAYTDLRNQRMRNTIFPSDILLLSLLGHEEAKAEAVKLSIPEFIRHNIVEWGIRDVA